MLFTASQLNGKALDARRFITWRKPKQAASQTRLLKAMFGACISGPAVGLNRSFANRKTRA
jgi:hypothetical protein